ncbi:MAG: type I restriction enzyme HsdR N-terminal domain-containing protein [Thermodesulfovibrionaceae bacterium]
MKILLNKTPQSPEERKKIITEVIQKQEEAFIQNIGYIQRIMITYLQQLGYSLNNDMEINKCYEVVISEKEKFYTFVDILIKIEDKIIFAIKCTPASIESWERFMIAFCRVVEPYQIPFAMITDGQKGVVIDVLSREVKETMEIPTKAELLKIFTNLKFISYAPEKIHKEKRILYAFDAIRCCPIHSI